MTLFQDRERAFEQMFVHDAEMRFRALALRNKMLGRWAADRLGLTGDAAANYVEDMRNRVADATGDAIVAERLREDLVAAGIDVSEAEIRRKMGQFLSDAIVRVKESAG